MTDEPCIYSEAAKEIERLRKELDIYKDLYAAEIVEKAMKKWQPLLRCKEQATQP